MRLNWTEEEHGTGVEGVDEQHREAFRQMNALLEACEGGTPKAEIASMLEFLDDYVRFHFACEERHFSNRNAAGAAHNTAAHRTFEKRFDDLRDRFEIEGASDSFVQDFTAHLVVWFSNHVRKVDSELRGTEE